MRNSDKVVLVTGCTKGIGLAIVERFASEGYNVAGCARNEKDLQKLFTRLSTEFPQQRFFMEACDVSAPKELKTFATDVLNEFRKVDVLVNNAGVFKPGTILEEEDGVFEELWMTNMASAYHLTRIIGREMVKRKGGHIFNICSTASISAYANGGSYCISKHAMLGFSKVLRAELKDTKVKVTSVLPGATHTNSWKGTKLPKSRFMPAEDIASLIWSANELSAASVVEEILVRPQLGDL